MIVTSIFNVVNYNNWNTDIVIHNLNYHYIIIIVDYLTGERNNRKDYGIIQNGIMFYCRKKHNSTQTPKTDKNNTQS